MKYGNIYMVCGDTIQLSMGNGRCFMFESMETTTISDKLIKEFYGKEMKFLENSNAPDWQVEDTLQNLFKKHGVANMIRAYKIPKEKLNRWQRFLLWFGYDFGFGHYH